MRVIDNFEVLMNHMDFVSPNDRYIVHILRRTKDCRELALELGSNESQRKIRSYCIESLDYLRRKMPAIKELCKECKARAYLVVQPKDNFKCLLNLGKKILDTVQMQNYSVKPERLLWTAYGEMHTSRKKLWIIDLDRNEMIERWVEERGDEKFLNCREWTLPQVVKFVKERVEEAKRNPNDVYVVPTKNGWHVITPPFNLQAAQKECRLMYEGAKEMPLSCDAVETENWYAPRSSKSSRKFQIQSERRTGWLHKDGMTVLYQIVED